MNLIVKNFNTFSVRILLIDDREWFVANDIAKLLAYKRERDAVAQHCKKAVSIAVLINSGETPLLGEGLHPQTKLIPESDVWRLIIKSHLPEAEKIENWIMEEVLPSIRKTGNYSISQNFQLPEIGNSTEQIIELKNDVLETSSLIEILRNLNPIDLFRLDKFYRKFHNFSLLEHFEIDLDLQFFLPTELGRMINKSPVEVNLILEHKGFQLRENGIWKLTEIGRDFGIEIIGKFVQIKWKIKSIV